MIDYDIVEFSQLVFLQIMNMFFCQLRTRNVSDARFEKHLLCSQSVYLSVPPVLGLKRAFGNENLLKQVAAFAEKYFPTQHQSLCTLGLNIDKIFSFEARHRVRRAPVGEGLKKAGAEPCNDRLLNSSL